MDCELWIAFIIIIFELLITTKIRHTHHTMQLWIAFIIIIFEPLITTGCCATSLCICCELLSLSLSLNHWSQLLKRVYEGLLVVNCFHYHYLWTTDHNRNDWQSAYRRVVNCFHYHYLWTTDHNLLETSMVTLLVVNCFHYHYLWTTDHNLQRRF